MSWERLGARLNSLPFVLAGPILRQVTPTSVTVWVVTRVGALVTLMVKDDKGAEVQRNSQRTVAVGLNLHIVAIRSVHLDAAHPLVEGVVYQYDMEFVFDGNATPVKLAGATDLSKLVYAPFTLPSFSLPPLDLTQLHLLQGSCRKPNAEGVDMMPYMDDLIRPSAANAYARPHQLLLTGDQIYADDVADALRLMLTDAGDALLWWDEGIPLAEKFGGRMVARQIHAARRWWALWNSGNGFTSEDLRSHLLSLGEYLAMYLFVWSPTLWPSTLPTTQDVIDELKDMPRPMNPETPRKERDKAAIKHSKIEKWGNKKGIEASNKSLTEFRGKLEKVRRVLANVPTYMVFDDHDVTDDWNMTRKFCKDTYGNELTLRVVQNALVAYALCQHWGNVPDEFMFNSGSTRPGYALLGLMDTANPANPDSFTNKAQAYESATAAIRTLLGIHSAAAISARQDKAVFHEPQALRYDFSVEAPGHQVIFTDTRSWRSFPDRADGTHLLTKNDDTDQFKQQITEAKPTGNRLLFVVLTTNAPTVQPIRSATRHDSITHTVASEHEDLYEAWDLPSVAYHRLLVALTNKLPVDASQQHTGAVVLLSGDVHHSFATRMVYRATRRYEDGVADTRANAVIAQLVGSSLKKQTDNTVAFHRAGYYAAPLDWATGLIIRHAQTEGYIGWSFPPGVSQLVATGTYGTHTRFNVVAGLATLDVTLKEPLARHLEPSSIVVTAKPHYRIRLDYLLPVSQFENDPKPAPIPPPLPSQSAADRQAAAKVYDALLKRSQHVNRHNPPTVVGVNNMTEIRIDGSTAAARRIRHIVHWTEPDSGTVKNTTYDVRLDVNAPNDSEFPDIRAPVEPP